MRKEDISLPEAIMELGNISKEIDSSIERWLEIKLCILLIETGYKKAQELKQRDNNACLELLKNTKAIAGAVNTMALKLDTQLHFVRIMGFALTTEKELGKEIRNTEELRKV